MARIEPEAQALLDRLARMDPRSPRHDKAIIERAIAAHLASLGLRPRPLRWCADTADAQRSATKAARRITWGILVISALFLAYLFPIVMPAERHAFGTVFLSAWILCALFVANACLTMLILTILRVFPIFWLHADWVAAHKRIYHRAIEGSVVEEARAAVHELAENKAGAALWEAAWIADWIPVAFESEGRIAARDAAEAVVASNIHAATGHPDAEALVAILRPLFDAFEAGLFVYWVTRRTVLCVLQPSLTFADGRLHAADGPAVRWRAGAVRYFWRGVQVPGWFIEEADRITVAAIAKERNQEHRRCMIEIYGRERFLRDGDAHLVHADSYGRLWEVRFGEEAWRFVEVVNGTPEPDGSYRTYILDVTGAQDRLGWPIDTAHAAVAATYGLPPEYYCPERRT